MAYKIKTKTRLVRSSTSKGNFEKKYGELVSFNRVSKKMFRIEYIPKNKEMRRK